MSAEELMALEALEALEKLEIKYLKTWREQQLYQDIATDLLCTPPPKRRQAARAKRAAGQRLKRLKQQFQDKGWTVPRVKRGRPAYR